MITKRILMPALAVLAIHCGSGNGGPGVGNGPDANLPDATTLPITLPTWMLEDVQPLSPMAGQTYGLETFAGRPIVVTLVQGF